MKYSLVMIETLKPGDRFVQIEQQGYGMLSKPVAYVVFGREMDDWTYAMATRAVIVGDKSCCRYHFSAGSLVFAEDP